ncbi:MAG TPA: hypothetical protein VI306_01890 [Pyrinomonadaceae bacterium]
MNLKLVMTSREKKEPPYTPSYSSPKPLVPHGAVRRHLVISLRTDDDWEILFYRHGELFEACFFRWAIHHEHASGSSFEALSRQVEQRIHSLKARGLKTARWRKVVH